jgi:hypothetical protein
MQFFNLQSSEKIINLKSEANIFEFLYILNKLCLPWIASFGEGSREIYWERTKFKPSGEIVVIYIQKWIIQIKEEGWMCWITIR